jgi:hypothetical protein
MVCPLLTKAEHQGTQRRFAARPRLSRSSLLWMMREVLSGEPEITVHSYVHQFEEIGSWGKR